MTDFEINWLYYGKTKTREGKMKKIMIVGLIAVLILSGCNQGQRELDLAKEYFNKGDYAGAINLLYYAKRSLSPDIKQKAIDFEKRIQDTLRVIEYRDMKENRHDRTYLEYYLGMSRSETESHTDEMIREKKIGEKKGYIYTIGWGTDKQKVDMSGYPIDFYISDYRCKGFIDIHFYGDKLDNVSVYLYEFPKLEADTFHAGQYEHVLTDLKWMYCQKYGACQDFSQYYQDEEGENIEFFWRDSNKGIAILEISSLVIISYQDLIVKIEQKEVTRMLPELEKDSNRQKARATEKGI